MDLLPGPAGVFNGALTAIRLTRLLRLARYWRGLSSVLQLLGNAFRAAFYLLMLVLLFMFVCGLLGMQVRQAWAPPSIQPSILQAVLALSVAGVSHAAHACMHASLPGPQAAAHGSWAAVELILQSINYFTGKKQPPTHAVHPPCSCTATCRFSATMLMVLPSSAPPEPTALLSVTAMLRANPASAAPGSR